MSTAQKRKQKEKEEAKLEEKVKVDSASKICARTFEIISIAGIVFLIIGLILYITGVIPPLVPMTIMEKYWSKKPSVFWHLVSQEIGKLIVPKSYWWIFDNISHSDMIAMIGVLIFVVGVIASLIGIATAYAKHDRRMLIVALIVLAITLYAVLRYV